ncbi:helix-turn-helix domain-containing protein [Fulvivirga sp. M361]|uniref:helix-turn-helix domain-containing protein n=1 Tax=Fulvivirga sp. M361 TaxID=2594266 RepID=UPI00117AFD00|nr:helix-turn-helix domain-containing protein [Fulvivirga sp. M361]TRX49053.1 helix-turn-helix domain-containing protein [Fulvivirga sp. M361]
MAQIIIDKQNGELAFRLERFVDLSQFDHVERKSYYSLIILNDSRLKLFVDFSEHQLDGSHMICLAPYQPYMLTSDTVCSGILLNFHPDFFCTYRHQNEIETEGVLFNNFNQPPYFKIEQIETFYSLIDQVSKEMGRESIAQHEVLVAYLKIFLIEAVRQKKQFDQQNFNSSFGYQSEVMQRLIDLIENRFCEIHAPQDYADILSVSSKTLARITKKYLNQTLTDLIINRIIVEAKRELYLTSKSVKQVGGELGYQDEFYFSRVFKKKVGVSPDVYRRTVGFAKLERE